MGDVDRNIEELGSAAASWVSQLVQIPSVNPLHAGPRSGPGGEADLARFVGSHLDRLGASEVVLDDAEPGRPNVYGFVPGRTERLVVIDAHTDTVTVEHMTDDPFDGRIEDGHVWGRGSLDTKASLGITLSLLERWARAGLRPEPTVLVVGTVSEEAGGLLGAARFRTWADTRDLVVDQLVACEPTQLAPVHGHKGGVSLRITVHGQSAHSATPERGRNAIEAAAPVILALRAMHEELIAVPPRTPVGTGTLLTAMISGGLAGNVVPDRCVLTVGRRIAPYEDPAEEYERIVAVARAACPLPITAEPVMAMDDGRGPGSRAFYQSPDSELVRTLSSITGEAPTTAPFGTNALRYDDFAREMVVFGPGDIEDAHRERECVRISDLGRTALAYEAWLRPA